MIDLHCHVLPALDDGPADEAESASLLMALAADGIDVVAATPHCREDFPGVTADAVADRLEVVRRLSSNVGGPTVIPAGEVAVSWAMAVSDDHLQRVSYGGMGKYLLLECPTGPIPARWTDQLERIEARGIGILLAHPERTRGFQDDPSLLGRLIARGVLVQINASSLLSTKRGSRSRQLASALVRERLAHVIATDAHSANWRPPLLGQAREAAEALAGPHAGWMVEDVPAAILAGTELPRPPVGRAGAAFGFLRRRRVRAGLGSGRG